MPDLPANGHPFAINRDARTLPFERFQLFPFEKILETAFGVAAVLADYAKRTAFRGLGNQPIKIRCIVGNEPYARRIRRAVLRETHDSLYERDGLNRRPARGARYTACRAVGADDTIGVKLFALAAAFYFQAQTSFMRPDSQKTRVKRERSACLLGFLSQGGNQP